MKILTVDDSFDWLNTHTMMCLRVFGDDAQIVGASSAAEALNIYEEGYLETPFDVVITDLQMETDFEPMYAGEWLIKEIRTLNKTQKIMIVSATSNIEQIAKNYDVDYISKRIIVNDPEEYVNKLEILYK